MIYILYTCISITREVIGFTMINLNVIYRQLLQPEIKEMTHKKQLISIFKGRCT